MACRSVLGQHDRGATDALHHLSKEAILQLIGCVRGLVVVAVPEQGGVGDHQARKAFSPETPRSELQAPGMFVGNVSGLVGTFDAC